MSKVVKTKTEVIKETINELQEKLNGRFPVSDVKQREGGFGKMLDYVGIDKVINRLNDVFPLSYSWEITNTQVIDKHIVVTGRLTVKVSDCCEVVRDGIGADKIGKDVDKSCKTAFAEALKKASHTLGVALYLWDEDERLELERERHSQSSDSFTKVQIDFMKLIKNKLLLDTDSKLNDLIKESPFTDIKKRSDLNSQNIDKFIKWVKAFKKTELSKEVK